MKKWFYRAIAFPLMVALVALAVDADAAFIGTRRALLAAGNFVVGVTAVTAAAVQNNACLYIQNGLLGAQPCGLNIYGYMSVAQWSAATSGPNTTDLTTPITNWLAACPSTGCNLVVPPGYFYSSTCNFTLANPFNLQGSGNESYSGTAGISRLVCANGTANFFTISADYGTIRDIAFVDVAGSRTAGSAILVSSSNDRQLINSSNISIRGFYDAYDNETGSGWINSNSFFYSFVHSGLIIRNNGHADIGGAVIRSPQMFPAANATSGIIVQSGGVTIDNPSILGPNPASASEGITADFTGLTTQQLVINNPQIDWTVGCPIDIKHLSYVMVYGGNLGAEHSSPSGGAGICLTSVSAGFVGGVTFNGNASAATAISMTSSQQMTLGHNVWNGFLSCVSGSGNTTIDDECDTGVSTVAGLPAASTVNQGAKFLVTDAQPVAAGGIVVGGNTGLTPVYSDGTNWRTYLSVNFIGLGDVVSNAQFYVGLRAYSLAKTGTRLTNICNSGDANCADINSTATGDFDAVTAQASPLSCGGAGGTCTIKTFYEQSGANACGGVACDQVQATIANRATLSFNCSPSPSTRVCAVSIAGTQYITAGNATINQPYTIAATAIETNISGLTRALVSNAAGTNGLYESPNGTGANALFIVNNTNHAFTAAYNVWHVLQAVGNSTTSSGITDGATTAISAASTALVSAAQLRLLNDGGGAGDSLVGNFVEAAIWGSALSAGQSTNVYSNSNNYWTLASAVAGSTLSVGGNAGFPIKSITNQYFTTSANQTYVPNIALQYAIVECIGQGGGGGGAAASATGVSSGGGGGAGGYSRVRLTAAQIGASQAITNTAAVNGGTAGNNAGGSGNDTSMGALCVAKGGSGGGGAATTTDGTAGAGGVGSSGTGDFKISGNAGTRGSSTTLTTVFAPAGMGGDGPWGGAAAAVQGSASAVAGNAGTPCGSGGGGGSSVGSASTAAGGAGGNGCVVVTEYNSQ